MKHKRSLNNHLQNMEEIVVKAQLGDEESFSYVILAYANAIKSIASSMYLSSMEYEDIVQEGTIGLMNAVRTFDKAQNTSFYTYANSCIKNSILNALKKTTAKKKVPLGESVSFDEQEIEVGGSTLQDNTQNPEKLLIVQENINAIHNHIQQDLSDLEKQVLFLYLGGLSYAQIANKTHTSEKSVDNALQRVRKKLIQFHN